MAKMKALVRNGPKVVGRAIVHGFNVVRFGLRCVDFHLADENVGQQILTGRASDRDLDDLDVALEKIGNVMCDGLASHQKLKRSVEEFKDEWRKRKPVTENLHS